jgi:molecular chaperone DnaJ
MAKRDYYEVLGIAQDASSDDIRQAFRREAVKNHPDKNHGDPAAEARFKEINEAYQVLSDDGKRRIYDRFGHAGLDPAGAGVDDEDGFAGVQDVFSHMSELFVEMFGSKVPPEQQRRRNHRNGTTPRHGKRGQDTRVDIPITIREALYGCTQTVTVRSMSACSDCGGSGAKRGTKPEVCHACGGGGQVSVPRGFIAFSQACGACHGVGQMIPHPCSTCRGAGAVETVRQVQVNFPAGIAEGQQLRVRGYGMPGHAGGPAGDLQVGIQIKPDERFERQGADLVTRVHVLFTVAILGGEVKVPVLDPTRDDVTTTMTVPPGTQNGTAIRLAGHGVGRGGQARGALVVIVHIDMPTRLTERGMALVAELNAELLGGGSSQGSSLSPG